MSSRARGRGACVGALLLAVGCSADPSAGDGPSASTSSAIIDGDASTTAQDFVVEIVHPVDGGAFVCSGALVAENLVLTARHCVTATPDEGFSCDESGDGTEGGTIGADYDPSTVQVYVGLEAPGEFTAPSAYATRFFHDDATNICNHDLALLEISPAIHGVPFAMLDLSSTVSAGQRITAVGWGVTANGLSPSVRQQLRGIPIIAVGPAEDPAGYDVAPSEFDVGPSICEGDSGGPALDAEGAVIGVVSRGGNGVSDAAVTDPAATCVGAGTVNIYTETAPFRDVILGAFAAVGSVPALANVPLGETCTNDGECSSDLCVAGLSDAGMTCSQDCASTACPSGSRCDVSGGRSLCVPAPSSGCSAGGGTGTGTSGTGPFGVLVVSLVTALRARAKRRRSSSRD